MSKTIKVGVFTAVAFLAGYQCTSCSGELPGYNDPTDLFEVEASGHYVLSVQDNSLKVILTVVNKFDETLDGEAVLAGSVRIILARLPEYQKNDSVTSSNLIQASKYNPTTKHLTLDPGDSIMLLYSWNFVDDFGRDLRQEVFRYVEDTTCVIADRRIAVKETFLLTGNMHVFKRTATATSRVTSYGVCHVNRWVRPGICPPVLPESCK